MSVAERVIELVAEHLAVNRTQVSRFTRFIEDIGADSLDIVELVKEIEEEFDIEIPDEVAEKLKTVGEVVDFIEEALKNKPPDPDPDPTPAPSPRRAGEGEQDCYPYSLGHN